jgi:hypothetical protein
MRRFFIWLGVFLMVFAFVVLFTFIVLPAVISSFDSVPPLKGVYELMFCKTGETLQDSRTTYRPSPGTTVTTVQVACVDNEGNGRDISNDAISVGVFGYLVPFLVGLFTALIAASREKIPSPSKPTPPRTSKPSAQVRKDPIPSANRAQPTEREQVLESAITRLKELKSALDLGLITQAEYDAKHKEILNDM